MNINGKIIVVTGAGSGIGRALSRVLSTRGANLVLADLNADGLNETQKSLEHPDNATIVVGDITKAETRAAIQSSAVETYGGIDALVNNAGVVSVGQSMCSAEETDNEKEEEEKEKNDEDKKEEEEENK